MIRRFILAVFLTPIVLASQAQEQPQPDDGPGLLDQTVPVAEEPAEAQDAAGEGEEDSAVPTEDDVLAEFARFRRLLEEQNFDEADTSAKRVVQMSIQIYGPQSHETAKALNNLAIVQHNNKQYDAAIQNFSSAIEILEIIEDRLNKQLVNPLKGLGAAQLADGRPDLASRSFDRATHITHVNEGPHNIEQVEILESLAEAQVRLGDIEAARDVLDRIHILNVRHFEDDRLGLLPSLMRRASWQHRAGYFNDERTTYRRAVRIIEESAGKNDPRLVDPLVRLGKSFYYFEPNRDDSTIPLASSGELYLKRAVRIAESSKDFPWYDEVTAKLALADYYSFTDSHNRARGLYKEIWDILSAEEDRLEMRNELFSNPVPVWEKTIPTQTNAAANANRTSNELQTGVVTVTYNVSPRGRVSKIRTDVQPLGFTDMQRMVHREIRRLVFRPQIVEGEPVASTEQVFRHEFSYLQSEANRLSTEEETEESPGSDES